MEELGAAGFVGPLVEGFIATHALGQTKADELGAGGIAAVTWDDSLIPWGEYADVVLFVDEKSEVWLCQCSGMEPVATLGRDEWARGRVARETSLGLQERAIAIGEIAISGYVIGAAARMIQLASEYARDRRQFGKAIGEFQAVSHALARCFANLRSARDLLALCVKGMDEHGDRPEYWARAARSRLLAVDASQQAAQAALQVHGGMGFVEGTILSHLARRVRHVSLLGPPLRRTAERALFPVTELPGLHDTA
jgi:hypothetical protein